MKRISQILFSVAMSFYILLGAFNVAYSAKSVKELLSFTDFHHLAKNKYHLKHYESSKESVNINIDILGTDSDDETNHQKHCNLTFGLEKHFELAYYGFSDYFSKLFSNKTSNHKNIYYKILRFNDLLNAKYLYIQNFRI